MKPVPSAAVPDYAMALYVASTLADDRCGTVLATAATADEVAPSDAASLGDVDTTSNTVAVRQQCQEGMVAVLAAAARLQSTRERLEARVRASLAKLHADAALVKAAVDARVAGIQTAAEKELKARLKAFDAQHDALMVSANQLACAVSMCTLSASGAMPQRDSEHVLASARRTLALVRGLSTAHLPANVVLEAVSDGASFAQRYMPVFALLRTAVSDRNVVLSGESQWRVCPGEDATSVQVSVQSGQRAPITSLTADDITVTHVVSWDEGAGEGVDHSTAAVCTEVTALGNGTFQLSSTTGGGVRQVTFTVNIGGSVVRSWTSVAKGTLPFGCHGTVVRKVPLAHVSRSGLAVSADGNWFAVA